MYYFNEYVLDSVAKLSTDKDNQASLYLGLEMVSQLQAELQNIKTKGQWQNSNYKNSLLSH